jgi:hypothetical protein
MYQVLPSSGFPALKMEANVSSTFSVFHPEDGSGTHFLDADSCLPNHTASHPRRHQVSKGHLRDSSCNTLCYIIRYTHNRADHHVSLGRKLGAGISAFTLPTPGGVTTHVDNGLLSAVPSHFLIALYPLLQTNDSQSCLHLLTSYRCPNFIVFAFIFLLFAHSRSALHYPMLFLRLPETFL